MEQSEKILWPSREMDIWKICDIRNLVEIKWSRKIFDDYKKLAFEFYKCGVQVLKNALESGHDNIKSDTWILPAIFMIRQSIELGLKAIIGDIYSNQEIQSLFELCCHNLEMLWNKCNISISYLSNEESNWLSAYFSSLELIDKKSDIFRFPFSKEFLLKYRNKFIDNLQVAKNLVQAFLLVKKCIYKGRVEEGEEFKPNLKPEFFIMAEHGLGNCYFWQSERDNGFYAKINGYIEVSKYIFDCSALKNEEKIYPLIFLMRNSIELCLKRIFYIDIKYGVPLKCFYAKRNSHKIKKDLWKNVRPVIQYYAQNQNQDLELLDIVEQKLYDLDKLDRNGDMFRYPTSYSLEYRFDKKKLDLTNIYKYMHAIINFLDGCDSMLQEIANYEKRSL